MTAALHAMVKAIVAEFRRQVDEDGANYFSAPDADGLSCLDGDFDLEKVARAGLAAIRTQPFDFALAATEDFDIYWSYRADGRPGGPEDVFAAMIDKILAD